MSPALYPIVDTASISTTAISEEAVGWRTGMHSVSIAEAADLSQTTMAADRHGVFHYVLAATVETYPIRCGAWAGDGRCRRHRLRETRLASGTAGLQVRCLGSRYRPGIDRVPARDGTYIRPATAPRTARLKSSAARPALRHRTARTATAAMGARTIGSNRIQIPRWVRPRWMRATRWRLVPS